MNNEEYKEVIVGIRSWKMVNRLITDYPELGYKTVDEFINHAILEFLKKRGLEIGRMQTWMEKEVR